MTTPKESNETISGKIKSGEYSLVPPPKKEARNSADIWTNNQFGVVKNSDGNLLDYAGCMKCHTVYVYKSGTGTSTLNRHLDNCKSDSGQKTLKGFLTPKAKVTLADRQLMTEACADICTKDLRPYNIVAGEGFKNALKTAMRIQAQSKLPIDVETLVPDRNTVRRHVVKRAASERQNLKPVLQAALKDARLCFTTDMWTGG